MSDTAISHGATSSRPHCQGPTCARSSLGVLLIVLVLFGQQLYGRATAAGRLNPALQGATGPRNVIVSARLHSRSLPQRARWPSTACSPDATARSTASGCAMLAPTASPAWQPSPGSRA